MSPFETTTNTLFRKEGLWRGWSSDTPTKKRSMRLTLNRGGEARGFTAVWKIIDMSDGDRDLEYGVIMCCLPELGFVATTRTSADTKFTRGQIFFMTILALTAKMGDHGFDARLPDDWEDDED